MKLLYTLALLSGFASCASISTIRRDYGGLDPSQIVLHGVVAGGSGCDGTSTITGMLSPDGQTVTVTIDTAGLMKAAYGPGVSILQLSKFCQINLSLSYPVGYQYSLDPSGLRGSLSLDFNVTSRVQQKVYFSGQGDQVSPTNGNCRM